MHGSWHCSLGFVASQVSRTLPVTVYLLDWLGSMSSSELEWFHGVSREGLVYFYRAGETGSGRWSVPESLWPAAARRCCRTWEVFACGDGRLFWIPRSGGPGQWLAPPAFQLAASEQHAPGSGAYQAPNGCYFVYRGATHRSSLLALRPSSTWLTATADLSGAPAIPLLPPTASSDLREFSSPGVIKQDTPSHSGDDRTNLPAGGPPATARSARKRRPTAVDSELAEVTAGEARSSSRSSSPTDLRTGRLRVEPLRPVAPKMAGTGSDLSPEALVPPPLGPAWALRSVAGSAEPGSRSTVGGDGPAAEGRTVLSPREAFAALLSDVGVAPGDLWFEVRQRIKGDPRFSGVPGEADRVGLFRQAIQRAVRRAEDLQHHRLQRARRQLTALLDEESVLLDPGMEYSRTLVPMFGSYERFDPTMAAVSEPLSSGSLSGAADGPVWHDAVREDAVEAWFRSAFWPQLEQLSSPYRSRQKAVYGLLVHLFVEDAEPWRSSSASSGGVTAGLGDDSALRWLGPWDGPPWSGLGVPRSQTWRTAPGRWPRLAGVSLTYAATLRALRVRLRPVLERGRAHVTATTTVPAAAPSSDAGLARLATRAIDLLAVARSGYPSGSGPTNVSPSDLDTLFPPWKPDGPSWCVPFRMIEALIGRASLPPAARGASRTWSCALLRGGVHDRIRGHYGLVARRLRLLRARHAAQVHASEAAATAARHTYRKWLADPLESGLGLPVLFSEEAAAAFQAQVWARPRAVATAAARPWPAVVAAAPPVHTGWLPALPSSSHRSADSSGPAPHVSHPFRILSPQLADNCVNPRTVFWEGKSRIIAVGPVTWLLALLGDPRLSSSSASSSSPLSKPPGQELGAELCRYLTPQQIIRIQNHPLAALVSPQDPWAHWAEQARRAAAGPAAGSASEEPSHESGPLGLLADPSEPAPLLLAYFLLGAVKAVATSCQRTVRARPNLVDQRLGPHAWAGPRVLDLLWANPLLRAAYPPRPRSYTDPSHSVP